VPVIVGTVLAGLGVLGWVYFAQYTSACSNVLIGALAARQCAQVSMFHAVSVAVMVVGAVIAVVGLVL
jgi:hypothetical protein